MNVFYNEYGTYDSHKKLEDDNTQEIRGKYITYRYQGLPTYTATCMSYCENCLRGNNLVYYEAYFNNTNTKFNIHKYDSTLEILKRIGYCNGCTRTIINNQLVKNESLLYPFENAILISLRKLPLDIKLIIFSFLGEEFPG